MSTRNSYKDYFSSSPESPVGIPKRTVQRRLHEEKTFVDQRPQLTNSTLSKVPRNYSSTASDESSPETNRCNQSEDEFVNVSDDTDMHIPVDDLCSDLGDNIEALSNADSTSESETSSESDNDCESQLKPGLLFENSKLTSDESVLLVFSFIFRHKLPKSAVNDLLTLINFHLPHSIQIPSSYYSIQKLLAPDFSILTRHFYCAHCESYIGEKCDNCTCTNCNTLISPSELEKSGNFFITFDLQKSLEEVLKFHDVSQNLEQNIKARKTTNSDELTEITDGILYKSLNLDHWDITCSVNSDGVAVFNSSKFSLWPILISINELNYEIRRKHTLLGALWFGQSKPNFNTFFNIFVKQCNNVSINGVQWKSTLSSNLIKSKVYFPIFVADSVARCVVQGINQFNGEYSCHWCLCKGETLRLDNGNHKWIFPPETIPSLKRNKTQFINHLEQLQDDMVSNHTVRSCYGIKSASKLLLLKKFDIVNGFVFDYMHTALLGVTKTFTSTWLDSKNNSKSFYIGKKIADIDKKFLKVLVPSELSRSVRSLNHIKFWKANEWRTWLYVACVVLKSILPQVYLSHFSKFVSAMVILCGNSISEFDIGVAKQLVLRFQKQTAELYGLQLCSFNLHLLIHAPDHVQNWGPLWAYSAFQYENYNGVLTNLFKGTQHVATQICNRVVEIHSVNALGRVSFRNLMAAEFFNSVMFTKLRCRNCKKSDNITFLGPSKLYVFSESEKKMLLSINIQACDGAVYKKCIVHSKIFNSNRNTTSKRQNCIVDVDGMQFLISLLVYINIGNNQNEFLFFGSQLFTDNSNLPRGIYKIRGSSSVVRCFRLNSISKSKFLGIQNSNFQFEYLIKLPNLEELE